MLTLGIDSGHAKHEDRGARHRNRRDHRFRSAGLWITADCRRTSRTRPASLDRCGGATVRECLEKIGARRDEVAADRRERAAA